MFGEPHARCSGRIMNMRYLRTTRQHKGTLWSICIQPVNIMTHNFLMHHKMCNHLVLTITFGSSYLFVSHAVLLVFCQKLAEEPQELDFKATKIIASVYILLFSCIYHSEDLL